MNTIHQQRAVVDAIMKKDVTRLQQFLDDGLDANTRTSVDQDGDQMMSGFPLLCTAARRGDAEIVRLLLQHGADPNLKWSDGTTALMYAAKDGDAEMIRTLLHAGAHVSDVDDLGGTALLYAATEGNALTLQELLLHHANIAAKDLAGRSALDIARERGHNSIVSILRQAAVRDKRSSVR